MIVEDPIAFSVIGWKNTGKTTLLCALMPRLPKPVSVSKVHHSELSCTPDNDSSKLMQCGAGEVLMIPWDTKEQLRNMSPDNSSKAALLFEGVLASSSLKAVLCTKESLREGLKPGYELCSLLLHDGSAAAVRALQAAALPGQRLCSRDDIDTIIELMKERHYG